MKLACVALFVLCAGPTAWASAQVLTNPSRVEFTCPDHALDDGHEIGFFLAGATEPVQTALLGDPPEVAGLVTAPIDVRPLPVGSYTAQVRANAGVEVSAWSEPSNPFGRGLAAPPGVVVR